MKNIYHRIISALLLLRYKSIAKSNTESFKYYIKHVKV